MSDTKTEEKKKNPYQLILKNVRLSYPQLFEARAPKGSKRPKYSATFIFDKKEHADQLKAIKATIAALLKEKNKGQALPPNLVCLRDGSFKPGKEGYGDGVEFMTSSSDVKYPPQIVDGQKKPMTADDKRLFAGCYVNGVVSLWWQDNDEGGNRINANLDIVQYAKPGEPFSSFEPTDVDAVLDVLPEDPSDTICDLG